MSVQTLFSAEGVADVLFCFWFKNVGDEMGVKRYR